MRVTEPRNNVVRSRTRHVAAITMCCVALVEYEDWVLCLIEQWLRACLQTYLRLVARRIQHVWRAALRVLTTTSSPPRGANYGRPETLVGLHSTTSGWTVSLLVYNKSTHRVRLHDTHQKMSHTSLSVMRG